MIYEMIVISTAVIAAVATRILSIDYRQGPVKASALLSFVVGLIFFVFKQSMPAMLLSIPAIFFGATFSGMSSEKRIKNNFLMAMAGLFFGMIFLATGNMFKGYGGGLGTTACISIVITLGVIEALNKIPGKSKAI